MSEIVGQAVEQAAAPKMISPDTFAHEWEYYRDCPHSCICTWAWGWRVLRWVLIESKPNCPWHSGGN